MSCCGRSSPRPTTSQTPVAASTQTAAQQVQAKQERRMIQTQKASDNKVIRRSV